MVSPKRPEILNLAMLPNDSTNLRHAQYRVEYAVLGDARDLPRFIDRRGIAATVGLPKRTQIGHDTIAPFEGVVYEWDDAAWAEADETIADRSSGNGRCRPAHGCSLFVDLVGTPSHRRGVDVALRTAEGAQIYGLVMLVLCRVVLCLFLCLAHEWRS